MAAASEESLRCPLSLERTKAYLSLCDKRGLLETRACAESAKKDDEGKGKKEERESAFPLPSKFFFSFFFF